MFLGSRIHSGHHFSVGSGCKQVLFSYYLGAGPETGGATAKNGREKTWLFIFSLSFPSSVAIPPSLLWKQNFGYSPHSHSQTDHLAAELSVGDSQEDRPSAAAYAHPFLWVKWSFSAFPRKGAVHIRITWGHMHPHWKFTLLRCYWRLASPGVQRTGSRWLKKFYCPELVLLV